MDAVWDELGQNHTNEAVRQWSEEKPYAAIRGLCPYKDGTWAETKAACQNLRTLFRVINAMLDNQNHIFQRVFSENLGLGSKGFERTYRKYALSVLEKEGVELEVPEAKLLSKYNIDVAPPMVHIRGVGALYFANGDRIHLGVTGAGMILSETSIENIVMAEADAVTSIENYTTFLDWPLRMEDGILVYTGGYADRTTAEFVGMMVRLLGLPSARHCGDIDAYGFDIVRRLSEASRVPIAPYLMSEDVYWENREMAIPITEANVNMFEKMLEDEYYSEQQKELFRLLLHEGKTLEQESLSRDYFTRTKQLIASTEL